MKNVDSQNNKIRVRITKIDKIFYLFYNYHVYHSGILYRNIDGYWEYIYLAERKGMFSRGSEFEYNYLNYSMPITLDDNTRINKFDALCHLITDILDVNGKWVHYEASDSLDIVLDKSLRHYKSKILKKLSDYIHNNQQSKLSYNEMSGGFIS